MKLLKEMNDLKELWGVLLPAAAVPEDSRWAIWLMKHDASIVQKGLIELAVKYRNLNGKMDADYMGKFASAVMNRLTLQARVSPPVPAPPGPCKSVVTTENHNV